MIFKGKKSQDDGELIESPELIISLDRIILDLANDKPLVERLQGLQKNLK